MCSELTVRKMRPTVTLWRLFGQCLWGCLVLSYINTSFAQSLSPPEALLQVTSSADVASQDFAIEIADGDSYFIVLCSPDCETISEVNGAATLSPGSITLNGASWSVDDDCEPSPPQSDNLTPPTTRIGSCRSTVSYSGEEPGSTTAELRLITTSETVVSSFLTGEVVVLEETISIDQQSRQGDEGTVLEVSVTRAATPCCGLLSSRQIQFNVATDSQAEQDVDFAFTDGSTIEWDDGEVGTKTLSVTLLTDSVREDAEEFVLFIDQQSLDSGVTIVEGRVFVEIVDVPPNVGRVRFTASDIQVNESQGAVTIGVERVEGSEGQLTVTISTLEDSAVDGIDYVGMTRTLAWDDGEIGANRESITIIINPREGRDPVRTFSIVLSNARDSAGTVLTGAIGTPMSATVTITDSVDEGTTSDPLTVDIVSGNDQTGLPGDNLEPLTVSIRDPDNNGEPAVTATVMWRIVPETAAILLDGEATELDDSGQSSNRIQIRERGFIRVIVTAIRPPVVEDNPTRGSSSEAGVNSGTQNPVLTTRIDPPPLPLQGNEIAFTVRAGLAAAPTLTGNQSEVGRSLDSACVALDEQAQAEVELTDAQDDLRSTCRALESRINDGSLGAALNRLMPEELFLFSDSIVDTTDLQVTNVNNRIESIRRGDQHRLDLSNLQLAHDGQVIPGQILDMAVAHWFGGGAAADTSSIARALGAFASGTVSTGKIDGGSNQKSADNNSLGITVGIDYRLTEKVVIGAAIGLTQNETDFQSDGDSADIDSLNITLFVTRHNPESGYIDLVLDAGRNDYKVRRRINLPDLPDQFAKGSTDANVLSVTLSAGRNIPFRGWELGPYARVSATSATVSAYSENAEINGPGIGSVLSIAEHSVDSTTFAIGGQISRIISTRQGVFQPQLRVEGEFESDDSKDNIVATFQHDPTQTAFSIVGNKRDTNHINLGLGTSIILPNSRSGYIFYETRLADEFVTQHWLKFGLRLEF